MDKELQELYNSMTPAERRKYQQEIQKQVTDTTKKIGNSLKDEVQKKGVVGTILEGAWYLFISAIGGK